MDVNVQVPAILRELSFAMAEQREKGSGPFRQVRWRLRFHFANARLSARQPRGGLVTTG